MTLASGFECFWIERLLKEFLLSADLSLSNLTIISEMGIPCRWAWRVRVTAHPWAGPPEMASAWAGDITVHSAPTVHPLPPTTGIICVLTLGKNLTHVLIVHTVQPQEPLWKGMYELILESDHMLVHIVHTAQTRKEHSKATYLHIMQQLSVWLNEEIIC